MKKNNNVLSVDELTQKEISKVESIDKLQKLEKEKAKMQKLIAEYKEREKLSARALVLYERKVKWIKQTIVDDILQICKGIETNKNEYSAIVDKILTQEIKDEFREFSAKLTSTQDKLYDVCNKLESNATITKSDREFISNKSTKAKSAETLNSNERFDRLKQQFDQKIGESVLRKPGRPKKSEQSIVSEIGLSKKPEAKINENEEIEGKLNDLFYKAPTGSSVTSSIPQTQDSVFDFNEALNPNVSLKDIMADIMSEQRDEEVKTYNLSDEIKETNNAQKKSKIELLESGFLTDTFLGEDRKETAREGSENKNETENRKHQHQAKPSFEKRFLSLQDVVKDL